MNFKRSTPVLMNFKWRRNTIATNRPSVSSTAETLKHRSSSTDQSRKYRDWTTYSDLKLTNLPNRHCKSRLLCLNTSSLREKWGRMKETFRKIATIWNERTTNSDEDCRKAKLLSIISSWKVIDGMRKLRQGSKTSVWRFKGWTACWREETKN